MQVYYLSYMCQADHHLQGEFIARHIYVKTDSGLEHLIASMQPRKHSEDYTKHSMDSENERPIPEALEVLGYDDGSLGALEVPDGRLQKRSMPAGLDYEELGGLSEPGLRDCPRAQNILE